MFFSKLNKTNLFSLRIPYNSLLQSCSSCGQLYFSCFFLDMQYNFEHEMKFVAWVENYVLHHTRKVAKKGGREMKTQKLNNKESVTRWHDIRRLYKFQFFGRYFLSSTWARKQSGWVEQFSNNSTHRAERSFLYFVWTILLMWQKGLACWLLLFVDMKYDW